MITIRNYRYSDVPQISRLYYETVHHINARDYSPEQITAWAPYVYSNAFWLGRFKNYDCVLVAEAREHVVGFAELEANGRIDCFYVHHQLQRRKIGTALIAELERLAANRGIHRLHAAVSISARPFFEKTGFTALRELNKHYRTAWFRQYLMEKRIQVQQAF